MSFRRPSVACSLPSLSRPAQIWPSQLRNLAKPRRLAQTRSQPRAQQLPPVLQTSLQPPENLRRRSLPVRRRLQSKTDDELDFCTANQAEIASRPEVGRPT